MVYDRNKLINCLVNDTVSCLSLSLTCCPPPRRSLRSPNTPPPLAPLANTPHRSLRSPTNATQGQYLVLYSHTLNRRDNMRPLPVTP